MSVGIRETPLVRVIFNLHFTATELQKLFTNVTLRFDHKLHILSHICKLHHCKFSENSFLKNNIPLEKHEGRGVVAHERLTEPRVTID